MAPRVVFAAAVLMLVAGCAGPSKLAERSEQRLAGGQQWRAWELATRALDKDPGNARARAAASAAAASIAQDWQRRIHALADADSLAAAEQALAFAEFRVRAVAYAVLPVDAAFLADERALRRSAARRHYRSGTDDLAGRRFKHAWLAFTETERYVPGYRDAGRLADRAWDGAVTHVAVLPLRAAEPSLGSDVASDWRDALARRTEPPATRFTRVLGSPAIEQTMTVAQLGGLTRAEAVRVGRQAGAARVVWGTIGGVASETSIHVFHDVIARRIVGRDADGHETVRWVDLPIEVLSRVRTVTVPVEYEIVATRDGASLAHQRSERSTTARVVWTSFDPEGDLGAYVLVSDAVRTGHPERARELESRWAAVCGEGTTLRQVLEARRACGGRARYRREALQQFMSGAAFVFLEELPPTMDLARAALAGGWRPIADDLVRFDPVDDVDLGVTVAGGNPH